MTPEEGKARSPLIGIYEELQAKQPKWHVIIGRPCGAGWIPGTAFQTATAGLFHALLSRIGERLDTTDRKAIAAAFALRYGWSSGVAIAPYLLRQCVPTITLGNVSLKFTEHTFFERVALHHPEGVMLEQAGLEPNPHIQWLPRHADLLARLRRSLVQQAAPIVDALYRWSGFSLKGMWGMITSSWGAQFMHISGELDTQENGLPVVQQFFAGNDLVSQTRPNFYPVTYKHVTHIYHRRATCCRYYLLPQGQYCASCPLISQEERVRRNTEWMKTLLDSQ